MPNSRHIIEDAVSRLRGNLEVANKDRRRLEDAAREAIVMALLGEIRPLIDKPQFQAKVIGKASDIYEELSGRKFDREAGRLLTRWYRTESYSIAIRLDDSLDS